MGSRERFNTGRPLTVKSIEKKQEKFRWQVVGFKKKSFKLRVKGRQGRSSTKRGGS